VSLYRVAGFREIVDAESESAAASATERPRLLSLRGSSIRGFEISGIDLRPCLFAGAHGLDGLHLDSTVTLGGPPPSVPLVRLRRWRPREVIAEEWHWRAAQDGRWPEWRIGPDRELPERLRGVGQPTAREVADIYRALRKGREDKRDEPGAEDFYYGEMEMRRHAPGAPGGPHRRVGERVLIWAYWATAGYGLRPLRSLIALGVVVASFASLTACAATARTPTRCSSRCRRRPCGAGPTPS
jgi:hypothetical protein